MGNICRVLTEKCVGCGICERNCPTGAIHVVDRKATINDKCVGCNICFKVCRKEAVEKIDVPEGSVRCDCCPVHCNVPEGCLGSCQRFRNETESSCVSSRSTSLIPPRSASTTSPACPTARS